MRRARWYPLVLMLLLVPRPSFGLDLHWASGGTDLSFVQATRCTLIIQASPSEPKLPAEWRLLWVTSDAPPHFVAVDTLEACLLDQARMYRIDQPATVEDSMAHRSTAHFCSDGNSASKAEQVVDLPTGGRGKLKVVALDSSDPGSANIVESNQVTYNGGVADPFPTLALRAWSSHAGSQFVVHAAGSGLSDVIGATARASDGLWSLPLQITERTDSTLTAAAEVIASMPQSELRLTSSNGGVTAAALPADGQRAGIDPDFATLADSCRFNHCYYFDPDPNVYPKDFAFVYAVSTSPLQGLFHLFYTREFKNVPLSSSTRSFGHAWSSDLRHWESDTSAAIFAVSANEWDRAHVWAPSIVQVGPTYYMFYTGVDDQANPPAVPYGNQRIGYATTSAIETGHATDWSRQSSPTYTVNWTGWARKDSTGAQRQQFRDPFIMADPDSAGRYLLFMVGQKQDADYAVGVARNQPGTLNAWKDLGYYRSTDYDYSGNGHVVESVTAFPDSAYPRSKSSDQATWRLLFTHGINSPADSSIRFSSKKLGPMLADTTLGPEADRVWSTPATNLFTYLAGDSTAWGTYATEHLRTGQVDFLATFDGAGILISRMVWNGTDFTLEQPAVTAVEPDKVWVEPTETLRLTRGIAGSGRLTFELGLPRREWVRVDIYDVAGRQIRSLIDGEMPAGMFDLEWDGRDESGYAVQTGMYFTRLLGEFGTKVVRAALVR